MTNFMVQRIQALPPAYFAMILATGIISIGASKYGWPGIAQALVVVNVVAYVALLILNGIRIVKWWPVIRTQFEDPRVAPGFLTFVAGTNVLANQLLVVTGSRTAGWVGGAVGLLFWVGLIYLFSFQMTLSPKKGDGNIPITGAWLLMTVSTQSFSVLCSNLARGSDFQAELVVWALMFFLLGVAFYALILPKIALGLFFQPFEPTDLTPPYWINIGAAAISVLAGANLITFHESDPLFGTFLPFVRGLILLLWVVGTWWWPLLLMLGVWKHVWRKVPLRYDPQLWSMVFPMGMYSVCTTVLAVALGIPRLNLIPRGIFPLATLAWALVAVGLVLRILNSMSEGKVDSR